MLYHILSLKYSKFDEPLVWWRGNNSGYTRNLDEAGIYTQEQIDESPGYYNKDDTCAIPIPKVRAQVEHVVMGESQRLKEMGSHTTVLQPQDACKLRDDVRELTEYAWHSDNDCPCNTCSKLREQMYDAMEGR